MTLNDVKPRSGEPLSYEILSLQGPAALVERLREMGFFEGGRVDVLGRLPFGGPWLVSLGSSSFALRAEEAACTGVKALS